MGRKYLPERRSASLALLLFLCAVPWSEAQVVTGSYLGDGLDNRPITGVGFRPDFVILKGNDTQQAVGRTSTMAGDSSKSMGSPSAVPAADQIQSLDPDGFTVGANVQVNAVGITYYWMALRQQPGIMTVGSYPGDGADNRSIGSVGFSPEWVVVLASNTSRVVHRTASMSGDISNYFSASASGPNLIQLLEPTGFQVGNSPEINGAGTTYHYVAVNALTGFMNEGTYPGDGLDNRNIVVGFQPEYVVVKADASERAVHRTASLAGDSTLYFQPDLNLANKIQALQPNGFQVGNGLHVNTGGETYYWVALGRAPVAKFRSIGTAPNRTTGGGDGTVAATNGSTVVTGTGTSWQTWNRGRGDVITINAANYTVLSVDTQTQLTLATPFTGPTGSGKTYALARQFTTLAAWETCISGGACAYFPVASSDLVADNRSEIGIAYKDSVFTLASTFTIQGSTTDATHRILLTADPGNRHNGVPGAGVVVNNNGGNEVDVRDSYVTVEWLELIGAAGANISPIQVFSGIGPPVDEARNVLLQNLLIHSFTDPVNDVSGIDLAGDNTVVRDVTIRNCMIWGGDNYGIEGDGSLDSLIIENVSVDGMVNRGIYAAQSPLTIRNTIVTGSGSQDFGVGAGGTLSGSNNTSSDATASFGANAQTGVTAASVFVAPGSDLHLKTGANDAVNTALDLSGSFWNDIDDKSRIGLIWDRGAHERGAVTHVELVSFKAEAADGEVLLRWETGSELDNLGFRLYRALSWEGPYESVTAELVPGLGSSPEGARYSYRDHDLENGVTYFYQLEDVETTGRTERHGPVAATPDARAGRTESDAALITYGDPEAIEIRVVESARNRIVMELWTGGFRATPAGDGTVRIEASGFEQTQWLPSRRASVSVPAGRRVRLESWEAQDVEAFEGLVPQSGGRPDVDARFDGTVRARLAPALGERSLSSRPSVELAAVAFQGDSKKAFVELRPFGRDASGRLVLARRLRFTLSFQGHDRAEDGRKARLYRSKPSHQSRAVVARLVTRDRGLYALAFSQMRSRRSYATGNLKLTRLGETRPFFVEPDQGRFGPGSTLYFLSEGGGHNPYGHEAVFELQEDSSAAAMRELLAPPKDAPKASFYWETLTREENRFYQAALLEAEDPWLWESLFAPQTRSFAFTLDEVARQGDDAQLSLSLQGASDFPAIPDHHVRVSVNGIFLTESSWDGKRPQHLETRVPLSVLRDGVNSLELEGVGDTDAAYSMVFLDRFEVRYPRGVVMREGYLEGFFRESAAVEAPAAFVLDVTGEPLRIRGENSGGTVRFSTEAGRSYLLVSEAGVRRPELRRASGEWLKNPSHSTDYLVVGPHAFLPAARPLLELRRRQGLAVKAAALEEVYSEFGFGEARPEALRDFLSYAYHQWSKPPRYVLLLGDGSYDFKDYLGTGAMNRVPPLMVKTSYLWTASDPAYVSVNGDDLLPDLALGRLPASSVEEVERVVGKILAYESLGTGADSTAVLVADDSDEAGDFEGDADSLARGVLSNGQVRTIYLGRLGLDAAREEILESFDEGPTTSSYIGHGGIHLWASENLFDRESVGLLSPQPRQPIVLTMNCLNGYFHFPFFNSLAEELLKAEGRGAIAAFSPSGLSLNEPAHLLHQALLRELHSGAHRRLGDAVAAAQASYADSGAFPELLLIYHLLGDPALTLR